MEEALLICGCQWGVAVEMRVQEVCQTRLGTASEKECLGVKIKSTGSQLGEVVAAHGKCIVEKGCCKLEGPNGLTEEAGASGDFGVN